MRDVVADVPGVVDLQLEPLLPVPQIQLTLDRERALQEGVSVATLAEAIDVGLHGARISPAEPASGRDPLVVTLPPEERSDIDALRRLPIRTTSGVLKPLGDFVLVTSTRGPNEINREDVARRIVVSANVSGRPWDLW